MKIVQVIPRRDAKKHLKTLLNEKERELRGPKTTLVRQKAGRWAHKSYPGWINWDQSAGGLIVAEVQSKVEQSEWQLLLSFVGYLDRHLGHAIESVTIIYR